MNMVADGLIAETPNGVSLVGGRSKATGKFVFPLPERFEQEGIEPLHLKRSGTLWSYTVQRFPPKEPFIGERNPATFEPYAVGYIELEGEIIVESRIATDTFEALKVGMPMELTVIEFARSPDGEPIHTFAFQPIIEG